MSHSIGNKSSTTSTDDDDDDAINSTTIPKDDKVYLEEYLDQV